MQSSPANLFEDKYREYKHFLGEGAIGAALIRLAEIEDYVSSDDVDKRTKYKWKNLVTEEIDTDRYRIEAENKYCENLNRVKKILSIGTEFNDDEIVLVLTLRVEMELLTKLFSAESSALVFPDCSDIDEEIAMLLQGGPNKKAYEAAIRQMRKNWGFPISTNWF